MKKYTAVIRMARQQLASENIRAYQYSMSGLIRSALTARSAQYLYSVIRADGFDIRPHGGQQVMANDIFQVPQELQTGDTA